MKIKELKLICRTSNEWIMLIDKMIEVKQYFKLPFFISYTFCRRKHIRPWIIYGNKDTEVVISLGQLLIYIMAIGLGEVCWYINKMAHCEFKNQYTKTKFWVRLGQITNVKLNLIKKTKVLIWKKMCYSTPPAFAF